MIEYVPNPEHRNQNVAKSQWTIPVLDEHQCFDEAGTQGWLDATRGWGLHRPSGVPENLGVGVDRSQSLFLAKFVRGRDGDPWHGYPADPQRYHQDVPASRVCRAWLDQTLLPPPLVRRVMKGQPCAL